MNQEMDTATSLVAKAESFSDTHAGLTRLEDVLNGPSCHAKPDGEWTTSLSNDAAVMQWPPDARTVLVLGLHHPEDRPRLDWWERGNTWGNKVLMERSESLKTWLEETHGLKACPLPYHLEKGGLFLKDAAVLAGLGVIGRSNLLLHPDWGPRIRLRALLIQGDLQPSQPLEGFSPCSNCDLLCRRDGTHHSLACWRRWLRCPLRGQSVPDWFGPSRHRVFRSLRLYGPLSAPGSLPGTMASADSLPGCPGRASPGKSALLLGTTAAFTSATGPYGFAVWCQLAASRRFYYAVLVHRPADFP